jgi:hypothetical protein
VWIEDPGAEDNIFGTTRGKRLGETQP